MPHTVTVIVPTYGRPDQLRRALESVFAQTRKPDQIVVVDDNAAEADTRQLTRTVCEKLEAVRPADIQFDWIELEANLGGGGARNRGAAHASGTYFAFLDDDDWWLPQKLEVQLSVFSPASSSSGADGADAVDGSPGLVYTSRRIVGPEGETKRIRTAEHRGWMANVLLADNVIGTTSCAMIPRRVFEEVGGFDESLPSRQDIDLWVRIGKIRPIDFVAEPVTVQQEHAEGRISRRFWSKARGLEMFLAKHHNEIASDRSVLAAHRERIGMHYLKYRYRLRGRVWILKALSAVPSLRRFKLLLVGVQRRKTPEDSAPVAGA